MKQFLLKTEMAWLRLPAEIRRVIWGLMLALTIVSFMTGRNSGINETEMRKAQARARLAASIERHPMSVAVVSEEDMKETGYRMKTKDVKIK